MLDNLIALLTNLTHVNLGQVQMPDINLPRLELLNLQAILRMVFMVVGAITLIVVTLGGFRYVFSQGDPQAAARAKDTILYGLIGVVVVAAAAVIVDFVLVGFL